LLSEDYKSTTKQLHLGKIIGISQTTKSVNYVLCSI